MPVKKPGRPERAQQSRISPSSQVSESRPQVSDGEAAVATATAEAAALGGGGGVRSGGDGSYGGDGSGRLAAVGGGAKRQQSTAAVQHMPMAVQQGCTMRPPPPRCHHRRLFRPGCRSGPNAESRESRPPPVTAHAAVRRSAGGAPTETQASPARRAWLQERPAARTLSRCPAS